jgi:hypothetical protein
MAITLAASGSSSARVDWHALAARTRPAPPVARHMLARDSDFLALQTAYRMNGGIARGDDVAMRMGRVSDSGYVDLARRIVAGQVFSFQWHDSFWLPMFQFEAEAMTLREAPRRVLDVLRFVLDGWSLAHWHVQPSMVLGGRRPLDLIDAEPDLVLDAARVTRLALVD